MRKNANIFNPWSANCYFVRANEGEHKGWLFYSYATPVGFVSDRGPVVRTDRSFSRTTSAQISKYMAKTLIGCWPNFSVRYTAFNFDSPDSSRCSLDRTCSKQEFLNKIARANGMETGKG